METEGNGMIDIHWLGLIGWIAGAFAFGWGVATWRANKYLKELDRQLDSAIGAANDLVKTSQELNARTKTDRARVDELSAQVRSIATEGKDNG